MAQIIHSVLVLSESVDHKKKLRSERHIYFEVYESPGPETGRIEC